jgi:hypothetical protein
MCSPVELCWRRGEYKVCKAVSIPAVQKEKVNSVGDLLYLHGPRVGPVLDDELLQQVERPLAVNLLANLHDARPLDFGGNHVAVFAVCALDDEFDDKALLQRHALKHVFLDRDLDLEPFRVGLSPDE